MEYQKMNDIAVEVIEILKYVDKQLLNKIPKPFINYLNELASISNKVFTVNLDKDLNEQNISEESKDLIALIFYSYIANDAEKKNIIKIWNENEQIYQEILKKKYNPDNIFKNEQTEENINKLPIEVKEGNLFEKIKRFIYKIFKKHNIN